MRLSILRRLIWLVIVGFAIASQSRADEFRGLWVDAWGPGFMNRTQIKELVEHCRTYNFNALVVQMRRRGDAFYLPQSPNPDPRTSELKNNFDALQELIDECHAGDKRIEVHCWVTTHLVWSGTNAPQQPEHVFNAHPEFLMQNSTGNKYIGEGCYLDPGNPNATAWNYKMARDIVTRYDIDGFHWDYIRYPAMDSGYNPTSIARYNAEFGTTGQPAADDAQFSAWRRRQVTDFLRWCNADLLEIKPRLVISCAVFGSRTDAFTARFQDWAAWNSEGIVDVCMPMGYTPDMALFQTRVDDIEAHRGIRRVYQGQGSYLCEPQRTLEQLNYVVKKGLPGYLLYSYRVPQKGKVDRNAVFSLIHDKLQPQWTAAPSLPWKTNPTNGILKGRITRGDSGQIVYNAQVTIEGPVSRTQQTEAHGHFAFFETPPGNYSIRVSSAQFGTARGLVTVSAGGNTNVSLALPGIDTIAPTIKDVTIGIVADTSALISWSTDEEATTKVVYGPLGDKNMTVQTMSPALRHSVKLRDLMPLMEYKFQAKSRDAAGNESTSAELSFKTTARGAIPEIILDNVGAKVVGPWNTGSSTANKYGADYRYKNKGTGAAYVEYRPHILKPGDYDVFEWHCEGSNRAATTPITIVHGGETNFATVNQQVSGGKWQPLGRFFFDEGSDGFVKIADNFSDEGRHIVLADAIKFVYIGTRKRSDAK